MKSMRAVVTYGALVMFVTCGCSTPSPLKYLALKKPEGVIRTSGHARVETNYTIKGWNFHSIRPAADIETYLKDAHDGAGTAVLRDADIQLRFPLVSFFGYIKVTDTVTAGKVQPELMWPGFPVRL